MYTKNILQFAIAKYKLNFKILNIRLSYFAFLLELFKIKFVKQLVAHIGI